jgi:hypothetical protein
MNLKQSLSKQKETNWPKNKSKHICSLIYSQNYLEQTFTTPPNSDLERAMTQEKSLFAVKK